MTKLVHTARIGAILFAACAAIAAGTAPASAASNNKEKRQESELTAAAASVRVCVQPEARTGSRIRPQRQCKTREQWIKETGIDPLAER